MKRTKQINHARFRKHWCVRRVSPVALVISSVLVMTGCEKSDETISLYMNSDDHASTKLSLNEQHTTAYSTAQHESVNTATKHVSLTDCIAEVGEERCSNVQSQAGKKEESQNNSSMLMPLIMGYMMGGGGNAQQTLLTSRAANSPAHDQVINASDRSIKVPNADLTPKPATTQTITRGGFGNTVAKHNTISNTKSSQTIGG